MSAKLERFVSIEAVSNTAAENGEDVRKKKKKSSWLRKVPLMPTAAKNANEEQDGEEDNESLYCAAVIKSLCERI